MRKSLFLAVTLAFAAFSVTPAVAETIAFDYGGGGCTASSTCIALDSFDWLQGNSLLILNPGGTTGTILYQANLDSAITPLSQPDILNGTGNNYFTAVASFGVTFTSPTTFTVNPGGTFAIYHDSAPADDLAGTGFNDGTLALTGTALSGGGSFAFYGTTPPLAALDSFNVDNYPGYLTFEGAGGSNINLLVTGVNTNYFPTLVAGDSLAFTNTSLVDPYRQIDPSAVFFNGQPGVTSTCGAGQAGTTASPCINGTGNRVMTQADANTSFHINSTTTPVPEPATLLLLGTGLLGSGFMRRRRSRKV